MNCLSIVIPTRNRSCFLDFLLERHIDVIRECEIPVFIYNNASTDNTDEVIEKWKDKCNLITSETNEDELKIADKSIETALRMSNTKYRWLLGDTYYLSQDLIRHVNQLATKESEIDLFILNLNDIVKNIDSGLFSDKNDLLSNFSTLMACVGCQVYSENIINKGRFEKYIGTNYAQLGVILDYASKYPICANWVQELSVTSLEHPGVKKRNWSYGSMVLEISARRWVGFILSLPNCYLEISKKLAIRNFGIQTNIFTIKGLLLMRARKNLTYRKYSEYSKEISLLMKYPIVAIVISVLPVYLLKFLCMMFVSFTKNKTKRWCSNE